MFIDSIVNRAPAPAGRHHREAIEKHAAPLELTTYLIGLSINMSPRWGWCGTRLFPIPLGLIQRQCTLSLSRSDGERESAGRVKGISTNISDLEENESA